MQHSNNTRVQEVLSDWQSLPFRQQPVLVKTFTAGLNHQTYLLSCSRKQFVLKLFSEAQKTAIFAQQFAAHHGIAPNVLYVNQEYDLVIIEYIPSNTLSSKQINSESVTALAKKLRKLHSIPSDIVAGKVGKFDIQAMCDNYLNRVDKQDTLSQNIHEKLSPVIQQFVDDSTQWCFCHNDLVKENCFVVKDQALFIDWEYAKINNPWFDLAAIIYYLNLDQQQTTTLIQQYQPEWLDKIDEPIFYASQISLLWTDMLWHIAQGGWQWWPDLKQKLEDLKDLAKKLNIAL